MKRRGDIGLATANLLAAGFIVALCVWDSAERSWDIPKRAIDTPDPVATFISLMLLIGLFLWNAYALTRKGGGE